MDSDTASGISCFGPEYQLIFENDPHAPESVDRVLAAEMILLRKNSYEWLYGSYTPKISQYLKGSRPELERILGRILSSPWPEKVPERLPERLIDAIAGFCGDLAGKFHVSTIDDLLFGGTEEAIIARGADWCANLARVACILFQVAGMSSRMVFLANTEFLNSGHVVVEVFDGKAWGMVNQNDGHVFRNDEGMPLSAWDLQMDLSLIRGSIDPGYFRAVAISNYFVMDHHRYAYPVSRINDYYRRVLSGARQ